MLFIVITIIIIIEVILVLLVITYSRLVKKLQLFLQLDQSRAEEVGTPLSEAGSIQSEATNEDSSSATSDDSFERIEPAELAEYESPKPEPENDIPSDTIETLSPTLDEPEAPTPEELEAPTLEEPDAPTLEEHEAPTPELKEELAASELSSASSDEPRPKSAGDAAADPVGTAGHSQ